jgi:hypothetical protein
VTAEFKVALKRPTPLGPVHVDAHVVSSSDDRASIEAILTAAGKVTAIRNRHVRRGKPDHPGITAGNHHIRTTGVRAIAVDG